MHIRIENEIFVYSDLLLTGGVGRSRMASVEGRLCKISTLLWKLLWNSQKRILPRRTQDERVKIFYRMIENIVKFEILNSTRSKFTPHEFEIQAKNNLNTKFIVANSVHLRNVNDFRIAQNGAKNLNILQGAALLLVQSNSCEFVYSKFTTLSTSICFWSQNEILLSSFHFSYRNRIWQNRAWAQERVLVSREQ